MPKLAWIIAGVLTTVVLITGLGLSSYMRGRDLEQAKADLAAAQAAAKKNDAEVERLKGQLADKLAESQARISELQQEKEALAQNKRSLEDEMRTALESKDVTISKLQGKLTVNILDRLMFDSGEAELKPEGSTVLRKVAAILADHPELKIHVIGHTDNVPIRAGARSRFASNWELSAARAIAAVRFLSEKAGVDPRRLGAVGYGEFRPIADNATAEGRAKNRRIAITILPDELAGVDVPQVASTNAPVQLPLPPVPAPKPVRLPPPVPMDPLTNGPPQD
jgi:chemotaxis protein MotB